MTAECTIMIFRSFGIVKSDTLSLETMDYISVVYLIKSDTLHNKLA